MNQNNSEQPSPNQQQRLGDLNFQGDDITFANAQGHIVTITQTKITQISSTEIKTRELNVASPYKGLKAFEPEDADHFFGRDQILVELNKELEETNLLLLLGASGSGKSSVVRAGLIPLLQRRYGRRLVSLMLTPDRDPFESFYASLLSSGCKQSQVQIVRTGQVNTLSQAVKILREKEPEAFLLIFIDQFEELFTVSEPEKRDRFIQDVCQLSKELSKKKIPNVKIVATMRSDFLNYLDPSPANLLAKLTEKHRPLITQMQPDQLRLAIEQPAAQHGVVFEAGLVEEIIKNVQGQAGYLPLLQYTLDLLWKSEEKNGGLQDRTLNTRSYREAGGVREALQCHADEIYANLSKTQQLAAQRIFLRLVAINGDEAGETEWKPVRHRASRAQFGDGVEQEVLAMLIDQKLLVSDASVQAVARQQRKVQDSTVEIAHEILLTAWTTLKAWIQENHKSITLRNRLNDDVKIWQKTKEDSDLWSGAKLTQVVELRRDSTFQQVLGGFSDKEQEFIRASLALRQRGKQRIYLGLGAIGSALFLVAVFWGWWNYTTSGQLTQIRRNLTNVSQQISTPEYQSQAAIAFAKDENPAQSLGLANQIQYPDAKASALITIAEVYRRLDQPQLAANLLEKVLTADNQSQDSGVKASALITSVEVYRRIGQPQRAADLLEKALNSANQLQNPDELGTLAEAVIKLDQPQLGADLKALINSANQRQGLVYVGRVTPSPISPPYESFSDKLTALSALAEAIIKLDQSQLAADLLKDLINSANQLPYDHEKARLLSTLAEAIIKLDQPQVADDLLRDLIDSAEPLRDSRGRVQIWSAIAKVHSNFNRPQEAAAWFKYSIDFANRSPSPQVKADTLSTIAEAYSKLDQTQPAADLLKQALDSASLIEDARYKATTLSAITEAYSKLDQTQPATDLLKQALDSANLIGNADAKATALISIAEAAANFNNWGQALKVTQQCPSDECKVESLAKVLTLHAEQQHPELKEEGE